MWTMINAIQLISLLPLTAVDFPQNVRYFFEKMLSSHGEPSFLPNIFEQYVLDPEETTKEPLNARFENYGWDNCNFLLLVGRKLLMWICLFGAYPFVYYMNVKQADKHRLCHIWSIIDSMYKYVLILRGFIMSYASMFLAAGLNLYTLSFSSTSDIISCFTAMAFILTLIYLPI